MFDKQDSGAKRSSQHIAGKTMPPFKNDFQELLLEMRKVRGIYGITCWRCIHGYCFTFEHRPLFDNLFIVI